MVVRRPWRFRRRWGVALPFSWGCLIILVSPHIPARRVLARPARAFLRTYFDAHCRWSRSIGPPGTQTNLTPRPPVASLALNDL